MTKRSGACLRKQAKNVLSHNESRANERDFGRGKLMMRDKYQRRAYAARRMSGAVDRLILAATTTDKEQARRWVEAWRLAAGIRKPAQAFHDHPDSANR